MCLSLFSVLDVGGLHKQTHEWACSRCLSLTQLTHTSTAKTRTVGFLRKLTSFAFLLPGILLLHCSGYCIWVQASTYATKVQTILALDAKRSTRCIEIIQKAVHCSFRSVQLYGGCVVHQGRKLGSHKQHGAIQAMKVINKRQDISTDTLSSRRSY